MFLPRPVRALLLDLDGTLIDTETVYRAAFEETLAAFGWSMGAEFDCLVGLPGPERLKLLPSMLGEAFPLAAFMVEYRGRRTGLLANGIALKPGAVALLDFAEASGLPVAVATSASRTTASSHLARCGLTDRLAALVTRDDVVHGKPAPDSFLQAAALLGVKPADCVAVEDSWVGLTAAIAAGTMAIMVPDRLAPPADLAARRIPVLPDLNAVAALVQRNDRLRATGRSFVRSERRAPAV